MSFRIIHIHAGNDEQVIITEDMDVPADEFLPPGFKIASDEKYDGSLPPGFPTDYNLIRE